MCFTRTRSPVRTRQETMFFSFACPILNSQCDYSLSFYLGFYGVMVSTLDFESSDPSSNLGRTWSTLTPWRNGSASDSRSEGCVFESRRGQTVFVRAVAIPTEAKTHFASNEDWTHDLWFTRPTLCHWAIEAFIKANCTICLLVLFISTANGSMV